MIAELIVIALQIDKPGEFTVLCDRYKKLFEFCDIIVLSDLRNKLPLSSEVKMKNSGTQQTFWRLQRI